MVRFICDHPDRVAARIFSALGTSCSCCAFWRGAVFGATCASVGLALLAVVLRG